jgi:hypothetical protein
MARRSRETDPRKKLASRPRRGASPQNSRNAGVRLEKNVMPSAVAEGWGRATS